MESGVWSGRFFILSYQAAWGGIMTFVSRMSEACAIHRLTKLYQSQQFLGMFFRVPMKKEKMVILLILLFFKVLGEKIMMFLLQF